MAPRARPVDLRARGWDENGVPKSTCPDDRQEKEPPGETNNPWRLGGLFNRLFVQVRQPG
jgi:hypothetical protein